MNAWAKENKIHESYGQIKKVPGYWGNPEWTKPPFADPHMVVRDDGVQYDAYPVPLLDEAE